MRGGWGESERLWREGGEVRRGRKSLRIVILARHAVEGGSREEEVKKGGSLRNLCIVRLSPQKN